MPKDIYRDLALHQVTENWEYRDLIKILHDYVEVFDFEYKLEIHESAVTIERLPGKALGHFRKNHNGFGIRGEIALDDRHVKENLAPEDWYDVIGALLHEVLHVWQQTHGKPGKGNYHNKEFRDKALECGLIIDSEGIHSYVPGGPFFKILEQKGVVVPKVSQPVAQKKKPKGNGSRLQRLTCACPENTRVGKRDLRILCLNCNTPFKPENSKQASGDTSVQHTTDSEYTSAHQPAIPLTRNADDDEGSNSSDNNLITASVVPYPPLNDSIDSSTPAQSYEQLFSAIQGHAPPSKVNNSSSSADIITDGRGFTSGLDKTMQLQIGCPGGCLYCYVIKGYRLAPKDVRTNWGYEVRNKLNVAERLRKHLLVGSLADKTIYWCGVTAPGASAPKVTRSVWETLLSVELHLRPRRIAVQTRMMCTDRDVELMSQYVAETKSSDDGPPVVVSYSIGTDRNDLIRSWELRTPAFEDRLAAITTLRSAGIWVAPTLSPFGLWDDLRGTLSNFKSLGIPYVTALFFKQKTGVTSTPKQFLNYIAEHFPVLLDAQWQADRVCEIASVMGKEGILVDKAGFDSLAAPHQVLN